MSIQRIQPGPRMSQAVVHDGTVYLAGQVADGADVKEQTRGILARIDELLHAAGSDKTKLLSATVWLVDISTWSEMNEIWDDWVDPDHAPARAAIEAKLAVPKYLVEIGIIAAA